MKAGVKPAIIIINVFCLKAVKKLALVNEFYPDNQVIHAKWNAGNTADLAKDDGLLGNNDKILQLVKSGNIIALLGGAAVMAVNKTAGHWKNAFYDSREVGLN